MKAVFDKIYEQAIVPKSSPFFCIQEEIILCCLKAVQCAQINGQPIRAAKESLRPIVCTDFLPNGKKHLVEHFWELEQAT